MKCLILLSLVLCACAGPKGNDGSNGAGCETKVVPSGAAAPDGGAMIMCATTTALLLNGKNGLDGTNGINGTNGTNGTLLTAVPVCPHGTAISVYPSVFTEVGLCFNDTLYAVYSTNGGFLTPIPPGAYNSNGVGSTCSFTVGAHCQVSY